MPRTARPCSTDLGGTGMTEDSAKERILCAAEALFAESGFDATPTSRIAERAGVPKGLVHYYFRHKADLLTALVERLPDERIEPAVVVVPGDLVGSLRRLVRELDHRFSRSLGLSHLLWREADTHHVVRDALHERFQVLVRQVRAVIVAATCGGVPAGGRRAGVRPAAPRGQPPPRHGPALGRRPARRVRRRADLHRRR